MPSESDFGETPPATVLRRARLELFSAIQHFDPEVRETAWQLLDDLRMAAAVTPHLFSSEHGAPTSCGRCGGPERAHRHHWEAIDGIDEARRARARG